MRKNRNIPVSHDNGTIIGRLLESVVPDAICSVVGRSPAENSEFSFHVAVDKWEKGEWWEENLRHEGCDDCGKSCCYSEVQEMSESLRKLLGSSSSG